MHAWAVRSELRSLGADARILDLQEFTAAYDLSVTVGATSTPRLDITFHDGSPRLVSDEISGLWWRRPNPPKEAYRSQQTPGAMNIARVERGSALVGSLTGFIDNAFNDRGRSREAAHKPAQLTRARSLGLQIPETLISNDPDTVRAFHEQTKGRTIYKMFTGSPFGLYGTRLLDLEDFEQLERLKTCPAIFQECVEGEFDVRATVVGDEVFAAKLVHDRDDEVIDTRVLEADISAHALPADVEQKLIRYVREAGLIYSAIDLRYSQDRGYVFFEANPEGQYLWIEIETGLKISHAIARRLTGASR